MAYGSLWGAGYYGAYWAAVAYSQDIYAYNIKYDDKLAHPSSGTGRYRGFTVQKRVTL